MRKIYLPSQSFKKFKHDITIHSKRKTKFSVPSPENVHLGFFGVLRRAGVGEKSKLAKAGRRLALATGGTSRISLHQTPKRWLVKKRWEEGEKNIN